VTREKSEEKIIERGGSQHYFFTGHFQRKINDT